MNKKLLLKYTPKFAPAIFSLLMFYPVSAFAASANCSSITGIGRIICTLNQILNIIIPLLIALGTVYFIWGVTQYFIAGGEEAKKKGKDQIIYGLIGLAVITGVWGLVAIITRTFGLQGALAPTVATIPSSGATCSPGANAKFQDILCYITGIINNAIIPLIFTLALVMFTWGVVQFVINSDEEAKKAKGKQFMIWGIIALTVMVSVWGLVNILGATFGVNGTILPQVHP